MKTKNAVHCLSGRILVAQALVLAAVTTVRADYQSTVLADSPLAYYPLDSSIDSGTTATDLSGNNNHGTYVNTYPEFNSVPGPSPYIPHGINFDGFTTSVDLSTGSNPGLLNFSGPITLEAWVQPADSTSFGDIFAKGYDSSTYQEIVLRVNGPYGANYYASSGSAGVSGGQQNNTWTHVVLSSDGAYTSLYINGGLVQRTADTTGSITFGDPWAIGNGTSAGNSRHFNGNLSQVALYNHGLTAAQVQTHYLAGMYGTATVTPGNPLQWSGSGNSGVWDTGTSANWINQANSLQTVFNLGDQVLFDDTPGAPTSVSVNGSVTPSLITVDASANNYTLSGPGAISGPASLVKKGSSTLTLQGPGPFYFTGPAVINGGTLKTAGNGILASVSSIVVTNGGTLDFSGNAIGGNKPITLSGAGVGGAGALVNSGGDVYDNVLNVTLANDATIGGGRWDFASGSTISGPHKLTLIRSSSSGYGEWKSLNIGTEVGDIELVTGKLGIKDMGSSFGSLASTLIVDDGFELDFWSGGCNRSIHVRSNGLVQILTSLSAFDANVTLDEGARWSAFWGSGTLPMNGTFTLNGVAHIVLGDANFVFNNVISGPGGFVWDAYNHQMVFLAQNTYTGPTIIGNGQAVALSGNGSISQSALIFFGGNNPNSSHMDVSGRSDQTLTLAGGQVLAGIGAVAGNLVVSPGATLSPAGTNTTLGITTGANPTGTISATGDVTLNGTTVIKLNGSGTNDAVQAGGHITYGGALNLVNISGSPLTAGDSFTLFNAAAYSGSFTNIIPATPGAGLTWDTTQLGIGKLSVAGQQQPVASQIFVSGGNLVFLGTNGTAGGTYIVLASTNLATPLPNWIPLATNTFDANGAFSVTNAINPTVPHRFYLLKLQ